MDLDEDPTVYIAPTPDALHVPPGTTRVIVTCSVTQPQLRPLADFEGTIQFSGDVRHLTDFSVLANATALVFESIEGDAFGDHASFHHNQRIRPNPHVTTLTRIGPRVRTLVARRTQIHDLTPLARLEEADLSLGMCLVDTSALVQVRILTVYGCSRLTTIGSLPHLHTLDASGTIIRTLEGLKQLTTVRVSRVPTSLSFASLPKLKRVSVSQTPNAPKHLPSLDVLDISGCAWVTELDPRARHIRAQRCPRLQQVVLTKGHDVVQLDVSHCPRLDTVLYNPPQHRTCIALRVSHCRNLGHLTVSGTTQRIDISGCTHLRTIQHDGFIDELDAAESGLHSVLGLHIRKRANVSGCPLHDVTPLARCKYVVLRNCRWVTSIRGLHKVPYVDAQHCPKLKN